MSHTQWMVEIMSCPDNCSFTESATYLLPLWTSEKGETNDEGGRHNE